jgi:hypothetical protein
LDTRKSLVFPTRSWMGPGSPIGLQFE